MRLVAFVMVVFALLLGDVQANTNTGCLTQHTRAILNQLKARFSVRVISTCVVKNIAGTNRPSQHSFGKAVDLTVPPGQKGAAVSYLRSLGAFTMTYPRMAHIHFDTGTSMRSYGAYKGRRSVRYAARRGFKPYQGGMWPFIGLNLPQ